ncbi:MAG: ATP phosphoribosyltransferase [Nitratireductor sp.]
MTITLAIPSKGRLKEKTIDTFAKAGLTIELPENARSYRGSLKGAKNQDYSNVEVAFMSASEIARELIAGKIHLGVTGEDLARETIANADQYMSFKSKLGFGHADVIVAVPEAWIDVETMTDLDDVATEFRQLHNRQLRIATKYWQLTQNFFEDHGIAMYRIVESLGATEGAPAAGTADVIVDITSTGSTLRANDLKILSDGIILKSEANLIQSKMAKFSRADKASAKQLCTLIAQACK